MLATTIQQLKRTAVQPYTWAVLAFAIFFALLFCLYPPPKGDWNRTFYPAGQNALTIYEGHNFHYVYPPWLAVILAPFAIFPEPLAFAFWRAASVIILGFAVWRFGGGIKNLALVLCTPFFYALMVYGQIDVLILLGITLATYAAFGLQLTGGLLILIKPQVAGLALPIIWLRSKHKKSLLLSSAALVILSLIMWSWWPLDVLEMMDMLSARNSIDVWPYGLIMGIPLFIWSWQRRSIELALVATYFCTPYVNLQSLVPLSAVIFAKVSTKIGLTLLVSVWAILIITASI